MTSLLGSKTRAVELNELLPIAEDLVLVLDESMARVLKASTLQVLREFGALGLEFERAVGPTADGGAPTVVVRYEDSCVVECWNCKNGLSIWRVELEGDKIILLQLSSDGATVFASTDAGVVAFISSDGVLKAEPTQLRGEITHLQLTPDGATVVAGTDKGAVALISLDGVLKAEPTQLEGRITHLQLSPDGATVVAGTTGGAVALISWDGVPKAEPTSASTKPLPSKSYSMSIADVSPVRSALLLGLRLFSLSLSLSPSS